MGLAQFFRALQNPPLQVVSIVLQFDFIELAVGHIQADAGQNHAVSGRGGQDVRASLDPAQVAIRPHDPVLQRQWLLLPGGG